MNKRQAERFIWLHNALSAHGVSSTEINQLMRAERTLGRWATAECNGEIQRDESTGQAYRHYGNVTSGPFLTVKIADREAGALKRVADICARHGLAFYHQGDPRGCALYIIRPGDIRDGSSVDSCYTNGIAVCID